MCCGMRVFGGLVVLGAVAIVGASFSGDSNTVLAADASSQSEWKKVLTEDHLNTIVEAAVKDLKKTTLSEDEFSKSRYRRARDEAYGLAIYAQAGKNLGNDQLARKAAALQDAALAMAEASKKKNHSDAVKNLEIIEGFASMSPGADVSTENIDLGKAIPIESLMHQVNAVNRKFLRHRRLRGNRFGAGKKPAEIELDSRMMAALTMAIDAHAPAKDEGELTKAHWLKSTGDVRAATLEMARLAVEKDADGWQKAFRTMDNACTSCHEIFRPE